MSSDPDDIPTRIATGEVLHFPGAKQIRSEGDNDLPPSDMEDPGGSGHGESGAGSGKNTNDPPGDIDEFDAIGKTNDEWALVLMGSRAVIIRERWDAPVEDRIKVVSIDAFKAYQANRRVRLLRRVRDDETGEMVEKHIYKDLAPFWLKSRERRTYDGIEFFPDPENAPGTARYFNLWRGFSVSPDKAPPEERAKKYKTYRDHLLTNVCNGNVEHFNWVFAWMAHMVQRPRQRPGTAVVIRGGMGTGKTVVGEYLGKLFPSNYFLVDDPRYVTGQFNAHMAACLFLQVDEGFWAGDKAAEGKLKGLVTAKQQMIEAKGIDPIRVANHVRLLFSSNEDWVVPAGMDERRFCVFDIANHAKGNRDYFGEIETEMENGGLEAFLADLLALDLNDKAVDVFTIPKTEALLEQKVRSFNPLNAWLFQRLHDGTMTHRASSWVRLVPIRTVYNDYLRQAEKQGIRGRRSSETEFAIAVRKILPGIHRERHFHEVEEQDEDGRAAVVRKRVWCWRLPPLEECRDAFRDKIGQDIDWDEGDDDQTDEGHADDPGESQ